VLVDCQKRDKVLIGELARKAAQKAARGAREKLFEYAWQSLPDLVKKTLSLRSCAADYALSDQEPSTTWIEIHRQLSTAERDFVVAFVLREGV